MQRRAFALVFVCFFLVSGCLPVQFPTPAPIPSSTQPPASAAPPLVSPVEAGPYWHQSLEAVSPADATAYYAALKTLTSDELAQEHQRLLKVLELTANPLPNVQLLLLACLPEQALVDSNQAVKYLEAARQDADMHRNLGDLFILLNDQLTSRATTPKSQDQDCAQSLRAARKKAKTLSGELDTCREERNDLAGKLQKLQDIERGLLERERKK